MQIHQGELKPAKVWSEDNFYLRAKLEVDPRRFSQGFEDLAECVF